MMQCVSDVSWASSELAIVALESGKCLFVSLESASAASLRGKVPVCPMETFPHYCLESMDVGMGAVREIALKESEPRLAVAGVKGELSVIDVSRGCSEGQGTTVGRGIQSLRWTPSHS